MFEEIRKSIIKTLSYADIFDYPLTLEEIWKYFISEWPISKEQIKKSLQKVSLVDCSQNHWYFFKGKKKIIDIRLEREKESKKKYKIVQKVVSYLSCIPSISFIGISGALAMNNVKKDDDIDLFVITQKNTLFTTRLLLLLILQFLGHRRTRMNSNVSDRICLNMLIDEEVINFRKDRRDLYNAHEIVQMVPIFERDNMYKRFLLANIWVNKFLPNALNYRFLQSKRQINKDSFFSVVLRLFLCIPTLEFLARTVQMLSIKKHQTTEFISNHFLAFHPYNYQSKILSEYSKNLKNYEKI